MTTLTPAQQSAQPVHSELSTLLSRCAESDESAFHALYLQTSPQLFGVLRRILRVESIAEEALQETYLKIWNNAGRYNNSLGAPLTWMTSIARYHALDLLRKRQTREDLESELLPDSDQSYIPNLPSIQDQLATEEVLTICLNELDERVKSCILKAYCEGYSQEELSQAKSTPLGTVKSWIRRGLLALRECIDELS